ncbi:MAG TPA: protein kinase [Steroidobacteraceae bacterium]|nr:protein kinase [Steroidobacteraceae bacterium]
MAEAFSQNRATMTPERWQRIKSLFAAALEVPPDERAALLALEAQGDAALIDEVASLLASHEAPGEFLEAPAPELSASVYAALDDHVGERIGAYRIVGTLGTGGMGDVFRALRDDDQYRAEVAIKLMRADLRDPLAEQRFKTERQILARLDHRNIARLLDGGTTAGGVPYVVMELVQGEPIDGYCAAHRLPVRERVQLFLQVCSAVSYAHQHLVVHRDLKPNNILVTADGSVKLLDFGIAKLLEANTITGTTSDETRTQLRAMTLDYASPEQVSGGAVTTVSDVYSLGVVLYRLLTGRSPYGARSNDAQRMAEILSDAAPSRPDIDADLDNILLMALRKEPQRRYGSVEQFANDLRNYLAGLPVLARGNAWRYRLGKFVRRRKVEIAAAAVVVTSLVGGLGFSIREARIAEQQRVIAQRHFDSVRKLSNKLFAFHDEIAQLPGSTRAREMLVTTSLEYLDALHQESAADPALQEELAVAYKKVGDIQGHTTQANLGDSAGALRSYANAIALLEPMHARDPKNARIGVLLARTYSVQTRRILMLSGAAAALPMVEKNVTVAEAMQSVVSDDFEAMGLIGNSRSNQAEVLGILGRTAEARASLTRMIEAVEAYARAHPQDPRRLSSLSGAYNNAAIMGANGLGKDEAYAWSSSLLEKGMAADEALLALEPENPAYQWSLAETRLNLADLYYGHGEYARALGLYRQAAAVFAVRDPLDVHARLISVINDVGLANALAKTGTVKEAESLFAASEKSLHEIREHGEDLQIDYALANIDIHRAELRLAQSRPVEARQSAERGLAQLAKVLKALPGDEGVLTLQRAGTAVISRVTTKL